LSGLRDRTPDDPADIYGNPHWDQTVPFHAGSPDDYPDGGPARAAGGSRRNKPLAIAGTIAALVVSLGLVLALLSPVFAGRKSAAAPNLPGVLEQPPPGATLAPEPAPLLPTPEATDSATPSPSARSRSTPPGRADANAAVENAVVALVNAERRRAKCDPVRADGRLRDAARQHSIDMATGGFLDHSGSDGSSADDRMRQAGYDSPLSENLARGFRSARDVMRGWLNSRDQRRNILDCNAQSIGVGVVVADDGTPYWTQNFGQ
jgi:uncharacterized protein YkwD